MILYKYFPPARVDVLRDKRVRFTQPGDFNDPFEFRPAISPVTLREQALADLEASFEQLVDKELAKHGAMLSQVVRNAFPGQLADMKRRLPELVGVLAPELVRHVQPIIYEQLTNRVGVLCLSEVRDSVLMWGHYTESYRGFVLGFDSEHDFFRRRRGPNDEFGFLRKVRYQVQRPNVDLSSTTSVEWFQTKSSDWAYEKEWRIVRVLSEASHVVDNQPFPICLFEFPADSVREIIVGMRAHPDLLVNMRVLAERFPQAALLVAREHPQEFRLNIEKA